MCRQLLVSVEWSVASLLWRVLNSRQQQPAAESLEQRVPSPEQSFEKIAINLLSVTRRLRSHCQNSQLMSTEDDKGKMDGNDREMQKPHCK